MQFNTAVGILWLGAALLCRALHRPAIARMLGFLVALLGFFTAVEYVTGMDFGIDQFLRPALESQGGIHPGRMAFRSALAFIAMGFSVQFGSFAEPSGRALTVSGWLAAVAGGVGAMACLAPVFGLERSLDAISIAYMAVPTGAAFLVFGASTLGWVFPRILAARDERHRAFPLAFMIALSFVTMALWQSTMAIEAEHLERIVQENGRQARRAVLEQLQETSDAMSRYAARLDVVGLGDDRYLRSDSVNHLRQIPFLRRIAITDRSMRVIRSFPQELAWQVEGFDHRKVPERRAAFDEARRTRLPSFSQGVKLRSGEFGYLMPVALYGRTHPIGYVYATIVARKIFQGYLAPEDFHVRVREGGQTVYDLPSSLPAIESHGSTVDVDYGMAHWELALVPTIAFIQAQKSPLPTIILVLGQGLSILLGLLLQANARVQRDRQRYAEEEQATLARFRLSLEATRVAAFTIDPATQEAWRSDNLDSVLGAHAPIGRDPSEWLSIVVPEDRQGFHEQWERLFTTDDKRLVEFRVEDPRSKERRWIALTAQGTSRSGAGAPKVVGILRDVTFDKRKDAELHEESEWRRAIVNSTVYSIISTDARGTIQTFNHAAEAMLGYRADEMVGKKTPEILHDEREVIDRAKALSLGMGREIPPGFEVFVAKARETRSVDEGEWTYVRKDGTRFPVNLAVTPIALSTGEIVGYVGIAIDLTERKRSLEAERIASDRLRRVIEATGEGIWEFDVERPDEMFIDDQAKRTLGFKPGESPGYAEILDLIHPTDRMRFHALLAEHRAKKNTPFSIEFRVREPAHDDYQRWVRAKASVVERVGASDQFVATFSDVTDQVRSRMVLQKALATAAEAAKAKSLFLASVSHEIRTPLNGLIGMVDLLLDTDLNQEQKKFARVAQQSGTALLARINDILDFSKLEAGKVDFDEAPFKLAELLEGQVGMVSARAKAKQVSIVTIVDDDVPAFIQGDMARIGQILLNLLGNAVKFTERGEVIVTVSRRKGPPAMIYFEVEDTGIGIARESLPKLFHEFTQADTSIHNRFGGTGLGLSISKKLVEAMGGQIGVRSAVGEGSTFWFTVPFKEAVEERPAPVVIRLDDRKETVGKRILVAEDFEPNQLLVRTILEFLGYAVEVVDNGAKAVAAIEASDYDLVLMDCKMPEMDGYEATRRIRTIDRRSVVRMPIIALTANAMEGDEKKCKDAGMDDYLTKPIKKDKLKAMLDRWLAPSSAPELRA